MWMQPTPCCFACCINKLQKNAWLTASMVKQPALAALLVASTSHRTCMIHSKQSVCSQQKSIASLHDPLWFIQNKDCKNIVFSHTAMVTQCTVPCVLHTLKSIVSLHDPVRFIPNKDCETIVFSHIAMVTPCRIPCVLHRLTSIVSLHDPL